MSLQWSSAVAAPACGLLGLVIIWLCRGIYHKRWILPLPNALLLFLGFSVLPSSLVFCVYPFLSPQPDLTDFFPVLPVAGISLLWTVFATFKQGFSVETPPGPAPRAAKSTEIERVSVSKEESLV
ncbi:MAG TPA: hypothetical protein VJ725_31300 [Thermoanaerobaculia bacterium]|nr:hypothetical protein [Thermoanaerobaculia bacterium]